MAAIEKIRAHFAALSRKEIPVPEWGLTVYATPVTLDDRSRIYKDADRSAVRNMAQILIVKAVDKDGKPLFTQADLPALLKGADSDIVVRVAAQIMGTDAPGAEELGN